MCGIAGMMTVTGEPPPAHVLQAMEGRLLHRGPDGNGHYRSGDVGIVQTRLAIIDLATGDQPLYEPGGAALVANAEIYNYIELRDAMPDAVFATRSDCELPLHLYRRIGLDFARELRGMYALALHDPSAGRLVLARDPFGIKPLYYAETAQGFVFASEPDTLLASGLVPPELVRQARNELLQLQFTTGRDTIFAGISSSGGASTRWPRPTPARSTRTRRWARSTPCSPKACGCISAPTCPMACSSPAASIRRPCWP
jgi:asparagine synthase (glutamine-hydrolysing)